MKPCSQCKQIKSITEFYKDRERKDGLRGNCKSCQKISNRNRKHRRGNKKVKEYNSVYRKTEKGKANLQKGIKRFNTRHPNSVKAQNAVNNAIAVGKIPHIKTRRCYFCYEPAEQYHHYKGYAPKFWLDIIPVCRECHMKIHRKIA